MEFSTLSKITISYSISIFLILCKIVSIHCNENGKVVNDSNSNCWNNMEFCKISAKLQTTNHIVPVNIDCSSESLADSGSGDHVVDNGQDRTTMDALRHHQSLRMQYENNLFLKRFNNIENITLNGCYANKQTFGLDFLPKREKIRLAVIEQFNMTEIWENAFNGMRNLEHLIFRDNQFGRINKGSFNGLTLLNRLVITGNGLIAIEENIFDSLKALRNLTLSESDLVIDNDFLFRNSNLTYLALSVKQINSKILKMLPEKLLFLEITKSEFDVDNLHVLNPMNLLEIHLNGNRINTLTISDSSEISIKRLNLSGNSITDLILKNCTNLISLDISNNSLTHLRDDSFSEMTQLRNIFIQQNHLKIFTLESFRLTPALRYVDLSNNTLKTLNIKANYTPLNPELKIKMDGNPWKCKWLLELSSKRPELFQIFKYEKFISRINVNGLDCVSYSILPIVASIVPVTQLPVPPNDLEFNVRLPSDIRKNQKLDVAFVFLSIFVGVVFLSVLLYLWIKCQKMFHLSFYRTLPQSRSQCSAFDVVREIPDGAGVANPDGYEMPLECERCHGTKEVQIAYEDQIPATIKVYEEIKETPDNYCYDHLKLNDKLDN